MTEDRVQANAIWQMKHGNPMCSKIGRNWHYISSNKLRKTLFIQFFSLSLFLFSKRVMPSNIIKTTFLFIFCNCVTSSENVFSLKWENFYKAISIWTSFYLKKKKSISTLHKKGGPCSSCSSSCSSFLFLFFFFGSSFEQSNMLHNLGGRFWPQSSLQYKPYQLDLMLLEFLNLMVRRSFKL